MKLLQAPQTPGSSESHAHHYTALAGARPWWPFLLPSLGARVPALAVGMPQPGAQRLAQAGCHS